MSYASILFALIRERASLSKFHSKISCPGFGPFATLNECFIMCVDEYCSNAHRACLTLSEECNTIVRSSAGLHLKLTGQLVELLLVHNTTSDKSLLFASNAETLQHQKSCFNYGQQLYASSLGRAVLNYSKAFFPAVKRFNKGHGAIFFLHLRKSGGKL